MEHFNLTVSRMNATEHRRSKPEERGVWLALIVYCVQQENHGRIPGVKRWADFDTIVVLGVPRAALDGEHLLWQFEGDDLLVHDYPEEHHAAKEVASRRAALLNSIRWARERLSDAESAADSVRIASLKKQISEAESELQSMRNPLRIHKGKGKDKDKGKGKDKDKDKGKADDSALERAQAQTPAAKQKPTYWGECRDYFPSIGSSEAEAQKFFDHFEANGWRQGGRTPLRNWRAAARNWVRRAREFGPEKNVGVKGARGAVVPPFNPDQPNAHTGGLPVFEPVAGEGGGQ